MTEIDTPKPKRGFAAMTKEQQRAIASKGGRAAHKLGLAYEFTSEKAREAGKKGGAKTSQDRKHMSKIGKRGGKSRAAQRKAEWYETR
jgi:general stress protein YciG